jgi:hypothetical protein
MHRTLTSSLTAAAIGCALALFAQPAAAALLYDAHFCVRFVTCKVNDPTSFVPDSFSTGDVRGFLETHLGLDLSGAEMDLSNIRGNANGDVFGRVDIFEFGIHTQFAAHDGITVCCILDEPYEIVDENDNGLFVGYDPNGISNDGQPLYPAFLARVGGPDGLPPVPYLLTPNASELIHGLTEFIAIDNENRILAQQFTPDGRLVASLELDPVIPEPPGALVMIPMLLAGWFARRSRVTP